MSSPSDLFFIQSDEGMEGPFDLLSMIRKIKNGRITGLSMVALDAHDAPVLASEHAVLREILDEQEKEILQKPSEIDSEINFIGAVKNGWQIFLMNPYTTLMTGLFGTLILFGALLFGALPGIIDGILSTIWASILFTVFLIFLCRKVRMQLVHVDYGRWLLKRWQPLLFSSLLVGLVPGILPALLFPVIGKVALLLIFIPGALWASYFLYVPLIIADRDIGLKEALAFNKAKMKEAGLDFYSIVFGLFALNILLPVLLPVTIPILLGAACDIYDKVYNEY